MGFMCQSEALCPRNARLVRFVGSERSFMHGHDIQREPGKTRKPTFLGAHKFYRAEDVRNMRRTYDLQHTQRRGR